MGHNFARAADANRILMGTGTLDLTTKKNPIAPEGWPEKKWMKLKDNAALAQKVSAQTLAQSLSNCLVEESHYNTINSRTMSNKNVDNTNPTLFFGETQTT